MWTMAKATETKPTVPMAPSVMHLMCQVIHHLYPRQYR